MSIELILCYYEFEKEKALRRYLFFNQFTFIDPIGVLKSPLLRVLRRRSLKSRKPETQAH